MNEWILGILTILTSLLLIFCFVAVGWYLIWKFLLSRFRFVRELLGDSTESIGDGEEYKIHKNRARKSRKE